MKTFLINLDSRPDRLDRMSQRLTTQDICFERISAVDGSKIIPSNYINPLLYWLYMGPPTAYAGQVACFLSHKKVWLRMVADNIEQALILEDDAVFVDMDLKILNTRLHEHGIDLLRIGVNTKKNRIRNQVTKRPVRLAGATILGRNLSFDPTPGGCAYILTLGGAEKLLKKTNFWFPVDHFLIWEAYYGVVSALILPPMVVPDNSKSETNKTIVFKQKLRSSGVGILRRWLRTAGRHAFWSIGKLAVGDKGRSDRAQAYWTEPLNHECQELDVGVGGA